MLIRTAGHLHQIDVKNPVIIKEKKSIVFEAQSVMLAWITNIRALLKHYSMRVYVRLIKDIQVRYNYHNVPALLLSATCSFILATLCNFHIQVTLGWYLPKKNKNISCTHTLEAILFHGFIFLTTGICGTRVFNEVSIYMYHSNR